MKTHFLFKISSTLFALAVMVFTFSCREDELGQGTDLEEESVLESASTGENETDDALEIAYQVETDLKAGSSNGRVASSTCASVTHDEANKKVIIDFGSGCTGPYGRTRSGKIIVTYSTTVGDSIANRIITFENYFVNSRGITGTIELRDVEENNDGNLQCTKRLLDLKVTFPNGESITFNGSRTREWISGAGDGIASNNVYRITGSVSGTSTRGRSFTHDITEPIISDWSCAAAGNFARIAGKTEMTKLGGYAKRKRIVDYGDGDCDNIITITTIRRTYTIQGS